MSRINADFRIIIYYAFSVKEKHVTTHANEKEKFPNIKFLSAMLKLKYYRIPHRGETR